MPPNFPMSQARHPQEIDFRELDRPFETAPTPLVNPPMQKADTLDSAEKADQDFQLQLVDVSSLGKSARSPV